METTTTKKEGLIGKNLKDGLEASKQESLTFKFVFNYYSCFYGRRF